MARDQALKKAAKANRRKLIVTAKRKAEANANSRSGLVREGAAQRILRCNLPDGLWENGIGSVVLSRGVSAERQYVALFMVDTMALGVEDLTFRVASREEAAFMFDAIEESDPTVPIAPEDARKLLRDVVQWADANGFPPHRLFAGVEQLFGAVVPSGTDFTPRFGKGGTPFYIPGPSETPAKIASRLAKVRERFGDLAAVESVLSLISNLAAERGEAFEIRLETDGDGPLPEYDAAAFEGELVS